MANMKAKLAFMLLAFVLCAQGWKIEINDWDIQDAMAKPKEVEFDVKDDYDFDLQITSGNDRPPSPKALPDLDKVKELFEKHRPRLEDEAASGGDDHLVNASVNIVSGFRNYNLFDWHKNQKKCCPLKWDYKCKQENVGFPCFYTFNANSNKWEWCCPFWPRLLIARCECCQCAILTTACAHEGRCQRRFKKQGFFAVCYRNGRWAYLQYMAKYLPSSCYCRIQ